MSGAKKVFENIINLSDCPHCNATKGNYCVNSKGKPLLNEAVHCKRADVFHEEYVTLPEKISGVKNV